MRTIATPLLAGMLLLASCSSDKPPDALDPDRVLHMAGEEAGQIPDPTARLTRQLNIAFRQIQNGKPTNARTTLAQARRTLEGPHDASVHDLPPLSDHHRLAGWVSVSELSRDAEDTGTANVALDRALSHLHKIEPAQARCEYVPGIAHEVRKLRGDKEAARLVIAAGEWAGGIAEMPTRRAALLAFATELFRCDDYEAARRMIRRDDDPTWRADSLTAVSDYARYPYLTVANARAAYGPLGMGRGAIAARPGTEAATDAAVKQETGPAKPFGKAVDFRSTFYRQD